MFGYSLVETWFSFCTDQANVMHRCTSLEHFLLSVEWSLISLFHKHSNADIEKESREIPTMNQTVHDEPRGNQVQINEEHNPSKSNFRKIYTLRFSHWLSGVDGGGGVIGGVSGGVPGSVPPNPANNSGGVIGTGVECVLVTLPTGLDTHRTTILTFGK